MIYYVVWGAIVFPVILNYYVVFRQIFTEYHESILPPIGAVVAAFITPFVPDISAWTILIVFILDPAGLSLLWYFYHISPLGGGDP